MMHVPYLDYCTWDGEWTSSFSSSSDESKMAGSLRRVFMAFGNGELTLLVCTCCVDTVFKFMESSSSLKILSDSESSGPYIFFTSQYSTMAESTMTQSVFAREGIFPALEGAWAEIGIPWNPNLFFYRCFGSWSTKLFSFKITVKLPQVCRSFVCFVLG